MATPEEGRLNFEDFVKPFLQSYQAAKRDRAFSEFLYRGKTKGIRLFVLTAMGLAARLEEQCD